ncbi:MAG: histidine phosphatase family protein [Mycobacteriaceae bacterium]
MSAPLRVLLLRHGETDHNAGLRMQGHLDVSLNDAGRAQAARAAAALAVRAPVRIVSSDLARAAETAQAVGAAAGVPVTHDERLRETHLGEWQGLTHGEVEDAYPGLMGGWLTSATDAPPGGENRLQVAERGSAVLQETLSSVADGGLVVLVAHGGLIAAVTARAIGLPPERWSAMGGLQNTHWAELGPTRLKGAAGWRLHGWNVGAAEPGRD